MRTRKKVQDQSGSRVLLSALYVSQDSRTSDDDNNGDGDGGDGNDDSG